MKFDEAQRWLDRADPQIVRGPSITTQIDQLKAKAKEGTLTRNAAAAWYAMVQELRRLADYYERDLIRQLRSDEVCPPEGQPRGGVVDRNLVADAMRHLTAQVLNLLHDGMMWAQSPTPSRFSSTAGRPPRRSGSGSSTPVGA